MLQTQPAIAVDPPPDIRLWGGPMRHEPPNLVDLVTVAVIQEESWYGSD